MFKSLLNVALKRFVGAIPTVLLLSIVVFFVLRALPADPLAMLEAGRPLIGPSELDDQGREIGGIHPPGDDHGGRPPTGPPQTLERAPQRAQLGRPGHGQVIEDVVGVAVAGTAHGGPIGRSQQDGRLPVGRRDRDRGGDVDQRCAILQTGERMDAMQGRQFRTRPHGLLRRGHGGRAR